jgi:hypothetical protein
MIRLIIEKALPDPAKIFRYLRVKFDSRPDPGVHEKIVPEFERIRHAFEEVQMSGRNLPNQPRQDFGGRGVENRSLADAVTGGAFGASINQPILQHRQVAAEGAQEELLV